MTNIEKLIKTYEKHVKGERTSKEYQRQQRQERTAKHKHLLLDTILNEAPFTIKKYQKDQIKRWIDLFNPYWKTLHRQSSDETIILALIFIQQKQANKSLNIQEYSITRKYDLTCPKFISIQNNVIFLLMKTTPLTYTLNPEYDPFFYEKEEN
jgi:hypothetical protein